MVVVLLVMFLVVGSKGDQELDRLEKIVSNSCQLGALMNRTSYLNCGTLPVQDWAFRPLREVDGSDSSSIMVEVFSVGWDEALFEPCNLGVFYPAGGSKEYVEKFCLDIIKSIVRYQSVPLTFHIVTDEGGRKGWKDYFSRAHFPFVRVILHRIEDGWAQIGEKAFRRTCGSFLPEKCAWVAAYVFPQHYIGGESAAAVIAAGDMLYVRDPLLLLQEWVTKEKEIEEGVGLPFYMAPRANIFDKKQDVVLQDGGLTTPSVYFTRRMNLQNFTDKMLNAVERALNSNRKYTLADMSAYSALSVYDPSTLMRTGCHSFADYFVLHEIALLRARRKASYVPCRTRMVVFHIPWAVRQRLLNVGGPFTEWIQAEITLVNRITEDLLRDLCPTYQNNFGRESYFKTKI